MCVRAETHTHKTVLCACSSANTAFLVRFPCAYLCVCFLMCVLPCVCVCVSSRALCLVCVCVCQLSRAVCLVCVCVCVSSRALCLVCVCVCVSQLSRTLSCVCVSQLSRTLEARGRALVASQAPEYVCATWRVDVCVAC